MSNKFREGMVVRWGVTAVFALVMLIGLRGSGGCQTGASTSRDGMADTFKGKVYVDSVPRGAHVFLISESAKGGDKQLGVTPLELDPAQCKGMKFWIMMTVEDYINKTKDLPDMKGWLEDFQTQLHSGMPHISVFFDFDTSVTRAGVNPQTRSVALFGPVYELKWPMTNRVCALFVPRGRRASEFYALMPPTGTFKGLGDEWRKNMITKFKFTEQQVEEAVQCLTRCGKYVARIKNPHKYGLMEYSVTAQGPECRLPYLVIEREIRE